MNYLELKPGSSTADFSGFTVGDSVVDQPTGATIQADTLYTLSYLLGTRNATPPRIAAYLQGTSLRLTPEAASNPAPGNGNWAAHTLVFDTSRAANSPLVGQPLTVGFSGGAGTSILFDDVTLAASPIPDPTTLAPTITRVAPATGSTAGGMRVTISGAHFLPGVTVRFGNELATGITRIDSTRLSVLTPAGSLGATDVIALNANALTGALSGGYRYVPPAPPLPPQMRGISTSDTLLQADLFALLAQTDANVIRLGFSVDSPNPRPPTTQDPLAPYTANLATLEAALPLARAAGLKIVLCAAETYGWSPTLFQGSASELAIYREHLATFWTAIAQRYLHEPAIVAYDLLNEPATDYFSQGAWYHNVLPAAIAAVRRVNPSIWLMVESEYWGQAGNFADMPLINDPYVIYSFHMYAPASFTNQGILNYIGYTATYPGPNSVFGTSPYTFWNKETLRAAMQTEINFSLAHPDQRMMVGEFGALRWADGADRWINDCIELFEEYGWDWCNHSPSGWNGYNVTYSPDRENWQTTAPDGGVRGAAWRVLHAGFHLNAQDEYGIPNGWKSRHFGAVTAPNAGALDDWDEDGMNNLEEYRAGTIPTSAASRFQIVDFRARDGGNDRLQWSSAEGKRYTIQTSTNLAEGFADSGAQQIIATPPLNTHVIPADAAP
ncbi:MAG: cellulase family glycosylhydrolase, partial [Chthoniobacterales bacterium]